MVMTENVLHFQLRFYVRGQMNVTKRGDVCLSPYSWICVREDSASVVINLGRDIADPNIVQEDVK